MAYRIAMKKLLTEPVYDTYREWGYMKLKYEHSRYLEVYRSRAGEPVAKLNTLHADFNTEKC